MDKQDAIIVGGLLLLFVVGIVSSIVVIEPEIAKGMWKDLVNSLQKP